MTSSPRRRRPLPAWAARRPAERAALLRAVAEQMDAERWATLAQMAAEAAKTVREGDPEVSEAIDFARYYATTDDSLGDRARSASSWWRRRGTSRTRSPPAVCSPP